MIDFRYHLVSLVAVFMALAVGILLGAGPLRGELGATLEGQVNELRDERAVLRTELDETQKLSGEREELIDALGPAAIDRRLSGVRIGVVVTPDGDDSMMQALDDVIAAAGGEVVLIAELDEATEDEESAELRTDVVDELAATLELPEPREGDVDTIATVIASALVGTDGEGQVGEWRAAQTTLEEEGLLSVEWRSEGEDPDGVTDRRAPEAFIVLSGPAAEDEEILEMRLDLVDALGAAGGAAVVVSDAADEPIDGEARVQDPLIEAIRADSDIGDRASTVDNAGLTSGQVVTVLTLGWALTGVSGHYGFGPDAEAVTPSVPAIRVLEDPWQDGVLQPGVEPDEDSDTDSVQDAPTSDQGVENPVDSDPGTAETAPAETAPADTAPADTVPADTAPATP